jgi:hypothetical protein
MQVKITIDCDNAAFEHRPFDEVARILQQAAIKVRLFSKVDKRFTLRDTNGNTVGKMEVSNGKE